MSWKVAFCFFQSMKSGPAKGYLPGAASVSLSATSCSGLRNGSGRRRRVSTMLKIAVLAPMPMASVAAAMAVRPLDFRRLRMA